MALTDVQNETYFHEYFERLEDEFLQQIQEVEAGDLSPLDLAVKFAKEREELAQLDTMRKDWLTENLDSILTEADNYGKDGYKGLKFSNTSRPQYDYSTNPKHEQLKGELKTIEDQMKTAYLNTGKNLINATFDGEEIILPKVTYTKPSLKTEKIKSK